MVPSIKCQLYWIWGWKTSPSHILCSFHKAVEEQSCQKFYRSWICEWMLAYFRGQISSCLLGGVKPKELHKTYLLFSLLLYLCLGNIWGCKPHLGQDTDLTTVKYELPFFPAGKGWKCDLGWNVLQFPPPAPTCWIDAPRIPKKKKSGSSSSSSL